ncbi:MAG: SIS domain-containing protein [Chloroflexota bacterium]
MAILLREIMEQPEVLRRLLADELEPIRATAQFVRAHEVHHVLIAARGTSDNAATYAKYLLGVANGLPGALAAPSLYTLYGSPPRLHHTLVMGISQSGMSPDIVAVLQDARAQGQPTLAITNDPASPLAAAAERTIALRAGPEQSVAATKTYTAELMALALLSIALDEGTPAYDARLQQAAAMPQSVEDALALGAGLAERAERYRYMASCATIARGYNYATALEVALKLKELTYVGATPYSSADFMHGPIAVVERGFAVLVIAPTGATHASLLELLGELRAREAELIVISDRDDALAHAHTGLRLPAGVPEWLSPIVSVIPGQLLAYHLARAKGLDPEQPRGLRKVTETR